MTSPTDIAPKTARLRLNPEPLTFMKSGGSGGANFGHIYEYLGDTQLSLVCKSFNSVGKRAMANLTYTMINQDIGLQIRCLREIQARTVESFPDAKQFTNQAKAV